MKQKLVLIAAVVIGLFAALLTRSYLNAKDREIERMKAEFNKKNIMVAVCAVKEAMTSGARLEVSDIVVVDVLQRQARGRNVLEKDALLLVGRKLLRPLQKHQPIDWSDVEGGDPFGKSLSSMLKSGLRAISVNVAGAASVSGMVLPNDHVDVLGTFSFPSKTVQGEMELVTFTILQNVLVLATGKETANSRAIGEKTLPGTYNTVTLEVTPREAEMLVFTEQIKGRISLALRNPSDVYYESSLPRVNFEKIQETIGQLNELRQKNRTSTSTWSTK